MRSLKNIHKHIPGFRQLSSQSMIIAGTYYAVALVALFRYWYWGLALLALPLLVFSLLDLSAKRGRLLPLAVSAAAGLAVLLGAAGALSSGGLPEGTAHAPARSSAPVSAQTAKSPAVSQGNSSAPAQATGPAGSVSPAEQAQYAYVAAKGSKVFHLPLCASAKRIKRENLVGFRTREEALAAGLQPCKHCKP